jgi:hypothetical protein
MLQRDADARFALSGQAGVLALVPDLELSPDGKQAAASLSDPSEENSRYLVFDVARSLPTWFTFRCG